MVLGLLRQMRLAPFQGAETFGAGIVGKLVARPRAPSLPTATFCNRSAVTGLGQPVSHGLAAGYPCETWWQRQDAPAWFFRGSESLRIWRGASWWWGHALRPGRTCLKGKASPVGLF
jgi:hypothetical protein